MLRHILAEKHLQVLSGFFKTYYAQTRILLEQVRTRSPRKGEGTRVGTNSAQRRSQTFLSGVLRQRGAGGEECWLRSGASPPVQSQVLGTSPHPLSVIAELLTVKAGE